MTRILLLALDIDLSRNRGDSIHLRNLVQELVRLGNKVHLVVGANPNGVEIDTVELSVRPNTGDRKILGHVVRSSRKIRTQVIYERRTSPKIAAAASALLGVPYVVELNGLPEEERKMQGIRPPTGPLAVVKSSMRTRLLRRAAAVVAVTSGLRTAAIDRYGLDPTKVHVIPNGVDANRFFPQGKADARRTLRLPNRPTACFVGNLVRWQGLETLVDALPLTGSDLQLLVIGDGPEAHHLLTKAKALRVDGRTAFFGGVEHERVPTYIAASDACVAPFTSERNLALGVSALKIYEYAACGRPIIVSAVPGATDIVEEFGSGIVVPPGDPVALARAMDRAVSDSVLSSAAMRASGAVRERNSWASSARRVSVILENVSSRHRVSG